MYRSKLEEEVAKMYPDCVYEPFSMDYTVPHTYTPDFVNEKYRTIYEVKGFFRAGDQQKYLAIRDAIEQQHWKFEFLLSHPNKPVRKGTKLTMSGWCDKHGIKWTKV